MLSCRKTECLPSYSPLLFLVPLELGKLFTLDVLIRNTTSVLVPLGADELDHELNTSGSVVGSAIGSRLALADAAAQVVELDTSTLGITSGEIIVSTTSQGVPAAFVSIPVMYEVVSAMLTGDYNRDGFAEVADYTVWRDMLGFQGPNLTADGSGDLVASAADYQIWTEHFSPTSPFC